MTEGQDFALHDKVSPSVLIATGLELEAEQCVICFSSYLNHLSCFRRSLRTEAGRLWEHALDRQKTKLLLRSNALQRKIDAWSRIQLLYCPSVARLRSSLATEITRTINPYDIPLWLPSQIKGQAIVSRHLQQIEWKLRLAQAYEALDTLRHHLQVRAYLYKFKDRFVRGQGANTRARNAISGAQGKIDVAAAEYRAAYDALLVLGSILLEFEWKSKLLPLLPADIRDLSEAASGESEGRRTISWIWRTIPTEAAGPGTEDYLRESEFKNRLRSHEH